MTTEEYFTIEARSIAVLKHGITHEIVIFEPTKQTLDRLKALLPNDPMGKIALIDKWDSGELDTHCGSHFMQFASLEGSGDGRKSRTLVLTVKLADRIRQAKALTEIPTGAWAWPVSKSKPEEIATHDDGQYLDIFAESTAVFPEGSIYSVAAYNLREETQKQLLELKAWEIIPKVRILDSGTNCAIIDANHFIDLKMPTDGCGMAILRFARLSA